MTQPTQRTEELMNLAAARAVSLLATEPEQAKTIVAGLYASHNPFLVDNVLSRYGWFSGEVVHVLFSRVKTFN
jgi:hypothetical protein